MSTAKVNSIVGNSIPLPTIDGLVVKEGFVVGAGQTSFTSTKFNNTQTVKAYVKDVGGTEEYSEVSVTFTDTDTFEVSPAANENDQIIVYGIDEGFKTPIDPYVDQLNADFALLQSEVDSLSSQVDAVNDRIPAINPSQDKGKGIFVNRDGTDYTLRNPGVPLGTTMNINAPPETIGDNWVPTNGQSININDFPDIQGLGILTSTSILEYQDGYFENEVARPVLVGDDVVSISEVGGTSNGTVHNVTIYDTVNNETSLPKYQPFEFDFPFENSQSYINPAIAYDGTNVIVMAVRQGNVVSIRYTDDLGSTPWKVVDFPTGESTTYMNGLKIVNGKLVVFGNSPYLVVATDYTDQNTYSITANPELILRQFGDIVWNGINYIFTGARSFFEDYDETFYSPNINGPWTQSTKNSSTDQGGANLWVDQSGTIYAYDTATNTVRLSTDNGQSFGAPVSLNFFVGSAPNYVYEKMFSMGTEGIVFIGGASASNARVWISNDGSDFYESAMEPESLQNGFDASGVGDSGIPATPYRFFTFMNYEDTAFRGLRYETQVIDVSSPNSNTTALTSVDYQNVYVMDTAGDRFWAVRNTDDVISQSSAPNEIAYSTDDGQTWVNVNNPATQFSDPDMVNTRLRNVIDNTIVVAYDPLNSPILYKTANNGSTWSKYDFSGDGGSSIVDVNESPVSGMFVTVDADKVFRSLDDGASFTNVLTTGADEASLIALSSGNNVAVYQTAGTVINYSTDGGNSFTQISAPSGIADIHKCEWFDGFLWVAGDNNDSPHAWSLQRTSNFSTWEDMTPTISLAGDDLPRKNLYRTASGTKMYFASGDRFFSIETGGTAFVESSFENSIDLTLQALDGALGQTLDLFETTTDLFISRNRVRADDDYYLAKVIGTGQYQMPDKTYNGDPTYMKLGWFPSNE